MRLVYVAFNGSIHTRRWVSFFASRGHEVHVVTCGGAGAVDYTAEGEVIGRTWTVHDLGVARWGKLGYVFKVRRARRVIRQLDADLVHVHWLTSYGMLAWAAGVRPLVATAHGDDVLIAPRTWWKRWLVKRVLSVASLVTVPSEHMREAVIALGAIGSDVEVGVYQYGVDVARLADVGSSRRRAHHERTTRDDSKIPQSVRIVSTRAMLDIYRLDVLIDALVLLQADGLAVHCDLVGDGPLRSHLESMVRDAGIEHLVTFHGHVAAVAVERIVADSDIYVSVAASDGVSLSMLEAMALGAVPVLSDIPANRSWINDGHTGVLVDIDPSALAGGIRRALELDPWRVARDNVAVVAERADMATNLLACEQAYDDLAGVQWDPTPLDDGVDAA